MLDERTDILLDYILGVCKDESFKIIDMFEMVSCFPDKFKMDNDGILQMLDYLKTREYIVEKYSDGEQFCLCPLPKGRHYYENKAEKKQSELLQRKIMAKITFIASFIGGFLGALAVFLVSNL